MTPYKKLNIKIKQLIFRFENDEISVDEYEVLLKGLYEEHLAIENQDLENSENQLLNFILLSDD